MTEVLRSPGHLRGSYTPDQSESEDYVNARHYVSDTDTDTDTEGYSGAPASPFAPSGDTRISIRDLCQSTPARGRWGDVGARSERDQSAQLSLVALLLATVRRSVLTLCQPAPDGDGDDGALDIGWPTDVQHVAHVTFDRLHGFQGLPHEFQVDIPGHIPSASRSVFGVSAESMQCSFDHHGNSVPTILLLMQERLYHQGGLKAEGIFRINAENGHHERVRDQLNKGVVPADIDLHCLAGLIKAWFRELPQGVLDALSPEQVLECHTEEATVALVKLLPATQAALLDWAVNLMADVVQEEDANKMNARNIAMVFAPNMTQMADPLTALMHAVQVMNLLKTLILRTLKDRQEAVLERGESVTPSETSEGDGPDNHVLRSSEQVSKSECDEFALVPSKRHLQAKSRSGNLVHTIDHHNQRVEAW